MSDAPIKLRRTGGNAVDGAIDERIAAALAARDTPQNQPGNGGLGGFATGGPSGGTGEPPDTGEVTSAVESLRVEGGTERTGAFDITGSGTHTVTEAAGTGTADWEHAHRSASFLVVAALPATGDPDIGYIRSTDETLWRDATGAGGWVQLNAAAPTDAQYLTLLANAALTQERVFAAGTDLTGVDSGAGAAYTVNHDDTAVSPGSYTNANITVNQRGHITAAANGSAIAHNILSATHSDTVAASLVLGDILAANSTPALQRVAGNTTNEPLALIQTGTGGGTPVSALPAWGRYYWQLDLRADGAMTETNPDANKTRILSNHSGGRLYTLNSSGDKHELTIAHRQIWYPCQGLIDAPGMDKENICNLPWSWDETPSAAGVPSAGGGADPAYQNFDESIAPSSWGGGPTAGENYGQWKWTSFWDDTHGDLMFQAQVWLTAAVTKFGKTAWVTVRIRRDPVYDVNSWNTDSFKFWLFDIDGTPLTAFTFSGNSYITPSASFDDYVSTELDISSVGADAFYVALVVQGKNWTGTVGDTGATHAFNLAYFAIDQRVK